MKFWLVIVAALFVSACSSEPPVETKAKAPEKPAEPLTGRQAFQYTYPPARIWANDCQPLTVRSINLDQVKSGDGKAGAWEIVYVSDQLSRARPYTWSAVEIEGQVHKGVFPGMDESWRGPTGQQKPFPAQAVKIDTPEALKTAIAKSPDYLGKPGKKPQVNFLLEWTPRFPNPVWRVLWGATIGTAEYSAIIDANTGALVGKN